MKKRSTFVEKFYNKMRYAQILKNAFDKDFDAPLEAWEQFTERCECVYFKKNEVIKHQNQTERYFYFMLKGSAGLFLWKENNFVCLDFAFDLQFCADYMSLVTNQPTPLEVIALESAEMLRMSAYDYHLLTRKTVGSVIRLILSEISFVDKQQQQIDLLTKSAKERYRILLQKFPGISNRIAQNHIASYLGITPQSLSRIRKEIW
jgi:CRP-like cAMP-binding protein